MSTQPTPEQSEELAKRIRIVKRDVSDLLFHFTRNRQDSSAYDVLHTILKEGKLRGTSRWSEPDDVICFTESPIQEFNSIFSLISIAASRNERPRYEPYGIAVGKKWLYERGGRPVIYDLPEALDAYPEPLRYRFVPYNPASGKEDFTWEREWRIKTDELELDPNLTLVIVPSSKEAFEIVYNYAHIDTTHRNNGDDEKNSGTSNQDSADVHKPRWLAVSLDMFGFTIE